MLSSLPQNRRRLDYQRKVLMVSPVPPLAYWSLSEPSGSVALDVSGNGRHGAYTACTLGQAGIGDGQSAASFDGSTSLCNIYSAALNTAFNGQECTIAGWFRTSAAGVWTDATQRFLFKIAVDGNNSFVLYRTTSNNQLECDYVAGGTTKGRFLNSVATNNWFHVAATVSKVGDALNVYRNGALVTGAVTAVGTWTGSLASTTTVLGAGSTTPANVWSGQMQHVDIWPLALPPGAIAELYAIGLSGL